MSLLLSYPIWFWKTFLYNQYSLVEIVCNTKIYVICFQAHGPSTSSIPNLSFVFLHSYFKMANQEARPFANNIVSDITSSAISSSLREKNSELLRASSLSELLCESHLHIKCKSTPGTFCTNKCQSDLIFATSINWFIIFYKSHRPLSKRHWYNKGMWHRLYTTCNVTSDAHCNVLNNSWRRYCTEQSTTIIFVQSDDTENLKLSMWYEHL